MKTTTQILPGVRAIGWLDCRLLQRRVDLHGICRTKVPVLTAVERINFFDEPTCSCKTLRESGLVTATASLKFHSDALLPIHRDLGFVVTDQSGNNYLIGCKEPPFPKVEVEMSAGAPDGDGAGFFYTVSHTALATLIECSASFD